MIPFALKMNKIKTLLINHQQAAKLFLQYAQRYL